MIRLDAKNNEKEKIIELLNYAIDNSDLELECLINNSSNRFNPNITHSNFISILKRFKGRPDFEVLENTRLTIGFPDSSKFNDTRILVKGIGAINSYCNNENINLIRNSVDFEMKSRPKTRLNRVNIPNYNIKFNLKMEQNFNNNDARINDILREWNDLSKTYRYKKTFSFKKKSNDFQIDVSIVKSSTTIDRFITVKDVIEHKLFEYVKKPETDKTSFGTWWKSIENKPDEKVMVRNAVNYFKTIKESAIFTNQPTYEVEIEYIKNKTTNRPKFKSITERKEYVNQEFIEYFRQIGSVLQCVQDSLYLMSNEDKNEVREQFIKVVLNSLNETNTNPTSAKSKLNSKSKAKPTKEKPTPSKKKAAAAMKGGAITNDNEIDFTKIGSADSDDDETIEETKVINETSVQEGGGGGGGSGGEADGGASGDATEEETDEHNFRTVESDYETDGEDGVDAIQKGGVRRLAEMKKQIGDRLRNRGIFFGPMIIDLSHNNAMPIDPEAIPDVKTNTNIHINYLVTDKTDGERNLLFINENGAAYGVGREKNGNIKSFGIVLPALANSILDGEYINRNEEGKIINNFYLFDAYIFKGNNVMDKPFLITKPDGRHHCIVEAAKYFTTGNDIIQSNPKMPFLIYKKDYLLSNSPSSYANLREGDRPLIQENCEKLLNKMNVKYGGFLEVGHLFTYKTDGLVFLPNNLAVFQENEDVPVKNPFISSRWNYNYKWKPSDHLTIDFKIEFIKDISTGKLAYRYLNDKKYLLVNLLSRIYPNRTDDIAKLNFYMLNSGISEKNLPLDFKFFSTDPLVGDYTSDGTNMGEAYFEVDKNDNVLCENGEIITDGIICECGYDRGIDGELFKWRPHRLRADKDNANAYGTAATTWHLINNPITKEFLSGRPMTKAGKESGGESDEEVVESGLEDTEYYTSNKNTDILTKALNNFSTSFVKRYLITRALNGYVKPKVMDLSIGKLGDIMNYTSAGVNTLVGLDINSDNFHNSEDNAAKRLLNSQIPAVSRLAEKTMLIVGDTSKNIMNGECVRDAINKYYIDVLYGRAEGNTPKLKKMEGMALDKFDLISCMYSIHYMLDNDTKLDNFLQNVSENLGDNCYFIGTCLDGNAILQEMGRSMEIKGEIDDKTVFLIRKLSDDAADYKDIKVGNKISVYYEKFTREFPENLVNMSYIKAKAKEHNLKLVEFKSFLEEPGNLLSQFEATNSANAKKIKTSPAMMTWAKFNSYFIFQKVRTGNTSKTGKK